MKNIDVYQLKNKYPHACKVIMECARDSGMPLGDISTLPGEWFDKVRNLDNIIIKLSHPLGEIITNKDMQDAYHDEEMLTMVWSDGLPDWDKLQYIEAWSIFVCGSYFRVRAIIKVLGEPGKDASDFLVDLQDYYGA